MHASYRRLASKSPVYHFFHLVSLVPTPTRNHVVLLTHHQFLRRLIHNNIFLMNFIVAGYFIGIFVALSLGGRCSMSRLFRSFFSLHRIILFQFNDMLNFLMLFPLLKRSFAKFLTEIESVQVPPKIKKIFGRGMTIERPLRCRVCDHPCSGEKI